MVLALAASDSTSTSKAASNAHAKSNLRIVLGLYALSSVNAGLGQWSGMKLLTRGGGVTGSDMIVGDMEDLPLPALVPLLVYRDIEQAHEFLVRAFGFAPGTIERSEAGNIVHGEVFTNGQVIWLHRVIADDGWVSQEGVLVSTSELVVKVDDVDAHCERARVAGAEIEHEPQDQPYGVREYSARDLEGRRWAFVTPLS